MADVLGVSALQVRHPVLLVILMKADDAAGDGGTIGRPHQPLST